MAYPNDQGQDAGAIPVRVVAGGSGGGATGFAFQAVIVTTGTAVQLSSHSLENGCVVKSLSSNSVLRQTTAPNAALTNVVDGTGNGYILEPGEAAPYSAASNITNTNQIYVNGQAGDVFSVIGA